MIALALPKLKLKGNLTAKEGRKEGRKEGHQFSQQRPAPCAASSLLNTRFISLAVCNCMHKSIIFFK